MTVTQSEIQAAASEWVEPREPTPQRSTLSPFLTGLEQKIEQTRAESRRLIRDYETAASKITTDAMLSDAGRQSLVKDLHSDVRAKVTALQAQEASLLKTARESLEREAFGSVSTDNPSALIAFRDAQDRADRIESSDDALQAIRRALTSGDDGLATAIARRAVDSNWAAPLNEFRNSNPAAAQAVEDLAQVIRASSGFNIERLGAYAFENEPGKA